MTLRNKFPALVFAAALAAMLLSGLPAQAQYNAFKDPTPTGKGASTAGSDFKAVADNIKGGKVAVGATAYIVVLFKNQGAAAVKTGKVNLYPSSTVSAVVALNQCADAPLTADAQCAITVAVKGLQSGSWRVDLLVEHDARSRIATASISGDVDQGSGKNDAAAKGTLEITPAALDFGSSPGGLALKRPVVLKNRTADSIEIWDIDMSVPEQSGFSYESQCPETLLPDEQCSIIVTWQPTAKGLAQGVLVVEHSGTTGMVQADVKGVFQPPAPTDAKAAGSVGLTPAALDFGSSPGGIALVRSVVLGNQTQEDVTIKDVALTMPEQSGFSLRSQCPQMLHPDETCSIIVTWQPTAKGLAQGVLVVQHSGKSGMAQADIKGVFQPPASADAAKAASGLELAPAALDFGTSPGGMALVRSIVLSNHTLENVEIGEVTLDVSERAGFKTHSQCPKTLAPEQSCNISVTWQPSVKGVAQGVLVVQHSGKSGMVKADIKGVLQPDVVKSATTYPEAAPSQGLLVADKEAVDFGSSVKGDAAITVMLVNAGSSDLTLKDIKLAVENRDLAVAPTGCGKDMVLKPIDACPLTLAWKPSASGAILNSLQIMHSGTRGVLILPVKGSADVAAAQNQKAGGDSAWADASLGNPDSAAATAAVKSVADNMNQPPEAADIKKTLQEFTITSLSLTRAVINGPGGGLVVRDGEEVVLAGVKCLVTIVSTGVVLTTDKEEVALLFDRSLKTLGGDAAPDSGAATKTSSKDEAKGGAEAAAAPAKASKPKPEKKPSKKK